MRIPAVATTLLLSAAFAWAQPAGPALSQLKTYLSLSDAQVQSIQTMESNLRASTQALRQQMNGKQRELNTAVREGSTSAAALGQLHLDTQALQKRIADAQAAARPQMAAVLTPAQQTLLQNLVEAQKLQGAVREAEMLGFITPAEGGRGEGMGAGMGMGGPGGRGGDGMMGPRGGRGGGPGGPRPQAQ
jgi:Spy/CpxP family protein refolding chaperone